MYIDGSIRILPLIRHHLLNYVCDADNWNNKGRHTTVKQLLDLHSPERIALVYLASFLKNGGSAELEGYSSKLKLLRGG